MKVQMLNSFTNFLEKSVNILRNLVAALPDLPDLNYISHSVSNEVLCVLAGQRAAKLPGVKV